MTGSSRGEGAAGLVALDDRAAFDPSLVGAKAAALAEAGSEHLPILPGSVITTEDTARISEDGSIPPKMIPVLRSVWEDMSANGTRSLVVRSSSTAEDGSESSMAGMFTSILGVKSWNSFKEAVLEVVGSAGVIAPDGSRSESPMAVLIQSQLDAAKGGILFGIDPITGDPTRLTVAVVDEGPDALVSGRKNGAQISMTRSGRVLSQDQDARKLLSGTERRALARLAKKAADHFGGPQDIEWAFDRSGDLYMFQSRPVTAVGTRASGPVLGPGPVAETFPDALAPLEEDLWIDPLRTAVEHALNIGGSATNRAIHRSPVVLTVDGRVAADLELFGIRTKPKTFFGRLDPRGPARKMMAAWRVGRLKAALPDLTESLAERVDSQLASLPAPSELTRQELLNVLERGRAALVSLHGYEILSGLLDDRDRGHMTSAELGLRALTSARNEGLDDAVTLAERPEVLALTPPSIGGGVELPATSTNVMGEPRSALQLGARETMRLRVRWVHEAMARAAWELGKRLTEQGALDSPSSVRLLDLDEVRDLVEKRIVPDDLSSRTLPDPPPLPGMFHLSTDGTVIPVTDPGSTSAAKGAGGGRGMGKVHHGREPQQGEVLVVRTLDPSLAPLLPRLGGLVAETGNVLSHLAILAREFGVPTVVGLDGAIDTFPPGTIVIVDGTNGEVTEVSEA